MKHSSVGHLMVGEVVSVSPATPFKYVAKLLAEHDISGLPALDEEDRLVGIITRRDLLQVFLRPDQEIRRQVIEEVIVDATGSLPGAVDVHVVNGVVTPEGVLERRSEIAVVLRLTRQMDAVVSVVDRRTSRIDQSRLAPPERTSHALPW